MEIARIHIEGLLAILMGGLCFLIPIAGLTARFALKPIVEVLARAREGNQGKEALALVERRLALLEQELQSVSGLRDEVTRIAEDQEFRRQLARPLPKAPDAFMER
jgi:hypothetical protein